MVNQALRSLESISLVFQSLKIVSNEGLVLRTHMESVLLKREKDWLCPRTLRHFCVYFVHIESSVSQEF